MHPCHAHAADLLHRELQGGAHQATIEQVTSQGVPIAIGHGQVQVHAVNAQRAAQTEHFQVAAGHDAIRPASITQMRLGEAAHAAGDRGGLQAALLHPCA